MLYIYSVTEDSDLIVYQCKVLLKLNKNTGFGIEYDICNRRTLLKDIQTSDQNYEYLKGIRDFDDLTFLQMAVLSGCDFLKNIPGVNHP